MCPRCRPIPLALALLIALVGRDVSGSEPPSKTELSKRGKEASALLELQPRISYAAAFCVNPSGLFLTTEQAVRQLGNAEALTLILHPGLKNQQVGKAKVVRRDADLNLVLLRIENAKLMASLSLGSDDDLGELLELAAFGFPVRGNLAEGEYPSLSVRLHRVASLRQRKGALIGLELDASLPAGFSGGAVLDPQGKVAGIVSASAGEATTSVISVGQIARFLDRPDVQFTPPTITAANRGDEHTFEVRVTPIVPSSTLPTAELILHGTGGQERRHALDLGADGVYRVNAIPAPGATKAPRVRISLTFADGAVAGSVADTTFSVAGKAINLSDVRTIQFGANGMVTLHDGKVVNGKPTGLNSVEVMIDEVPTRVNLAEAVEAQFEPLPTEPIAYTLVIRQAGKELVRQTGQLGAEPESAARLPLIAANGIRPPVLAQDEVIKTLPGSVTDICVGGGGRFLILYLAQQRQLAIFDANEARIVKYLPAAEDNIRFAAGQDKLVIVLPRSKVIQRWSLKTFERELSVPLPIQYQLTGIAMGSASNGPLMVHSADYPRIGEMFFFDIRTMKKLETTYGRTVHGNIGPQYRLRAAADGSVFTSANQSFILRGTIVDLYQPGSNSDVLPSPDGRVLFATGQLFTAEGSPLSQPVGGHGHMVWYVPAVHGPYYLSLNEMPNDPRTRKGGVRLDVHIAGESRPLASCPQLEAMKTLTDWSTGVPPFDRHVFLIPAAHLLVILPKTNDRLALCRLNIDQLIEKSGIDFLYVTSRPPTQFRPGSSFSYHLVARSKKGGLRYKLESGPAGMTLSPTGLLHWAVLGKFDQPEVDVVITVSDASGQEVFHNFQLTNANQATIAKKTVTPNTPASTAQPDSKKAAWVPRAVNPLPIKPAPLKADRTTLPLPGTIQNVCVGGGGRFFILALPQPRQLAIFDVNEARIVKYLPIGADRVLMAAGMDKLIVVAPDKHLLQRWSLTTFQREVVAAVPLPGKVNGICMGSASGGPLLIAREAVPTTAFLDVITLRPLDIQPAQGQLPSGVFLRASADGTMFGMRQGVGGEPHMVSAINVRGSRASVHTAWIPSSVLIPSPDGRFIYTGTAVYNDQLQVLFPRDNNPNLSKPFLPANHGSYFMRLEPKPGAPSGGTVSFFFAGQEQPFAHLDDIAGVSNEAVSYGNNRDALNHDQRIHFIPAARLVVSIPPTNDRLLLQRFDPDAALAKSGIDYLIITSRPATSAVKGKAYSYPIMVKSRKGGVKYKLESGPSGMSIAKDGQLTWAVPTIFTEAEVTVIVSVSDLAGQEVFQTFKVAVKDRE